MKRAVLSRLLPNCLCIAGLSLASSCGDGDDFDDAPQVALPCDVRESACQRAIFNATALLRNQRGARLPPIRVISRAQFAEETRSAGGTMQPSRRDVIVDGALRLLAFLPPDRGSGGAAAEASIEGVAAYYHKRHKAVTIIDDAARNLLNGTYTLSHEFVHALQDQRESLDRLDAKGTSSDSRLAIDVLVEGEAVVLSRVLTANLRGLTGPAAVDTRFYDSLLEAFLAEIAESTAPLTHALLTLPYPVGGKPLAQAYADSAYEGIGRFLKAHPLTYAEWVEGGVPAALPQRLGCGVSEPPQGYGIIVNERFGGAGLLALLTRLGLSGSDAFQAARAWTNDTFTIYGPEAPADSNSVLSWRIGLRSATPAQQLTAMIRAAGLPVTVQQTEREVLITGATDLAVLAAWSAGQTCRIPKNAGSEEPTSPLAPPPDWLP